MIKKSQFFHDCKLSFGVFELQSDKQSNWNMLTWVLGNNDGYISLYSDFFPPTEQLSNQYYVTIIIKELLSILIVKVIVCCSLTVLIQWNNTTIYQFDITQHYNK